MRTSEPDPDVKALMDEARALPDCAARNAAYHRAALRAEALDDLDTAWEARRAILSSSSSHADPKFEYLFLNLAWCVGVSDREPDRFSPSAILWEYKWVASAAPRYASVPRPVLFKLLDDLETRYIRAGWGRRAAVHKRLELHLELGEIDEARRLLPMWQSLPRDRGSDCMACEASGLASFLVDTDQFEEAIKVARPIMVGKLSCATVPHSIFGTLLWPLVKLGRRKEAMDLFERGRRLVARMEEGGGNLLISYLPFAACFLAQDAAVTLVRSRFAEAAALREDSDRCWWGARMSATLEILSARGVDSIDLPHVAAISKAGSNSVAAVAAAARAISRTAAAALDARNGNTWISRQADELVAGWVAVGSGDRAS